MTRLTLVLLVGCGASIDSSSIDMPSRIDLSAGRDAAVAVDLAGSNVGGCGVAASAGTATYTLMVTSPDGSVQARSVLVRIPTGYDGTPRPLVFGWHGTSGTSASLDGKQLFGIDTGALFVYPQGVAQSFSPFDGNTGWDMRSNGADMAFFDQLFAWIDARYCVDHAHISSFGFSAGAIWSNLLACKRSSVIRAAGSIAGMDPFVESPPTFSSCGGTVAWFGKHNDDDRTIPLSSAEAARDHFVTANGCAATTSSWPQAYNGDPHCVRYDGCNAEVIWCEYPTQTPTGGHTWSNPPDTQNLGAFLLRH
jgi:poly(3-hydroxybutyrate) depolymerase